MAFQDALNLIWQGVRRLNEHVDKNKPWKMAKEEDIEPLKTLLFDLVTSLRMIAGWLTPFMPQTAAKIQSQLGVRKFPSAVTAEEILSGPTGEKISKGPALFPRK